MLKILNATILPSPDFLDPDKLRTGDELMNYNQLIPLEQTIRPTPFSKAQFIHSPQFTQGGTNGG